MLSRSVARSLIHYRTLLVAIAHAVITWIILIIAPLGLFAVITCTAAIFLASLTLGLLGDVALLSLLRSGQISLASITPPISVSNAPSSASPLPEEHAQRSLPKQ
jgi:hypothetical protein